MECYLCNPGENLFLVADGIGGRTSGQIASRLAVQSAEEFVIRTRFEDAAWPIAYRSELTLEQNRLLAAATHANQKIRNLSNQDSSMKGMGTTFIGILFKEDELSIVNAGDSRLYRIRAENIEQMTQDHTLVAEQEKKGYLTKEQAIRHPQKHILTSALGVEDIKNIKIDVFLAKAIKKDLYLICSDGLNDMLSDKEIVKIINDNAHQSLKKIAFSLIHEANLAGGRDNITVVLLSFN